MLVLVPCLSLAVCGGEETLTEDDKLLPFGLRFGMIYDEVKEVREDLPELTPATSNDGYITSSDFEREDIESYLADVFKADSGKVYGDIEEGITVGANYGFSHNENKELYELYLCLKFMDGVSKGEYFFNHFCDFFDEGFGVEAEINETDSSSSATYETETIGVSVMLEVEESVTQYYTYVYVILHDKIHELSE